MQITGIIKILDPTNIYTGFQITLMPYAYIHRMITCFITIFHNQVYDI